jgi:hypothetical protein
MVSDPLLFTFSMIDTGAVLFLLVYFVSFLIYTENSYIKVNHLLIRDTRVVCYSCINCNVEAAV